MSNPFPVRRKSRKPRKDAGHKIGRPAPGEHGGPLLSGKARSDRRAEIFERAYGQCEEWFPFPDVPGSETRCPNLATEWSHRQHGANKCDCYSPDAKGACSIASCSDCHQNGRHGSKCTYPRRAGKVMTSAKAKAYWHGTKCFCDGPKPSQQSFCLMCMTKLPGQLHHDLHNTQWDDYLKVLAECETAIQKWNVEHGPGVGDSGK